MSVHGVRWSSVLLAILVGWAPAAAQKAPPLADLLTLAGEGVARYAQQLGTVAVNEEFMQYETNSGRMGTPKRVNSQILFFAQDDGTLANFRDVVAIDSVAVRPKDDRLPSLFKRPTAESIGSAQTMTDDAVKAYINPLLHILDRPTLALDLLRAENQADYTYKVEGNKTLDGTPVVVLKFNEKGKGHTVTNASAVGRYWIEPTSGAVHQTELGFSSQNANIHATVRFTKDAQLGVLLPSELAETAEASSGGAAMSDMGAAGGAGAGGHAAVEGRAAYSKYRRPGA